MLRVHELDKEMSGEDRFHLENISFHLPKGYICGLVGENGAGKTTLLRCLMGLYRSTGDIVIDGHNLNSDEAAAREVIAVVGDEGFFDENINLEKLGKYYGQMYVRFDMEKYLGYLERFNLDRKQKYKKLSKGMKIKAQLAFALSYGANLFLFDEPTAGLDPESRHELINMIQNIQKNENIILIFVSHNMNDIAKLADKMIVLDRGKIAMEGTPREVFEKKDELNSIGLGVPKVTEIMHRISEEIEGVKTDVLTLDEALEEIARVLND